MTLRAPFNSTPDEWEIDPSNVEIKETLGSGQFGVVAKAVLTGGTPTPAAIAAFSVDSRLLQHRHSEGAIMGAPLRTLSYIESQKAAESAASSGGDFVASASRPSVDSAVSTQSQTTYDLAGGTPRPTSANGSPGGGGGGGGVSGVGGDDQVIDEVYTVPTGGGGANPDPNYDVYEVPTQPSVASSANDAGMYAVPSDAAGVCAATAVDANDGTRAYAAPAAAVSTAGQANAYYEIPTADASPSSGAGGDGIYEQPAASASRRSDGSGVGADGGFSGRGGCSGGSADGGVDDDDVYEQPASLSAASNSFGTLNVAVKQCRSDEKEITAQDKRDFLAEAECMKPFKHRNVVQLIGVVSQTEPLMILIEICTSTNNPTSI